MMKMKSFIFMLVIGMASLANATVIDVVTAGEGHMGHAGTSTNPLVPNERIDIQIVLNYNQYNSSLPSYDGYFTDSVGLDLEVSGPGILSIKVIAKMPPVIAYHSEFSVWSQSDPQVEDNAIAKMSGGVLSGGIKSTEDGYGGPGVLIWDLLITADGNGEIFVDLGLQDPASRYAPYTDWTEDAPYPAWQPLLESDLGDLTLYAIPEPTTIALLGLGGLMLMRKK